MTRYSEFTANLQLDSYVPETDTNTEVCNFRQPLKFKADFSSNTVKTKYAELNDSSTWEII